MSLFNINMVILSGGYCLKDAELRYTSGGTPQLSFCVVMNESTKVQGQWESKPEYYNVVYWGQWAEKIAPNIKKGTKVSIEGRLSQESYEDKSGQKRTAIKIIANKVLYERKGEAQNPQNSQPQQSYANTQKNSQSRQSYVNPQNGYAEEPHDYMGMDYSEMTEDDVPF
jgi:single-strand DNA-binding protein